MNLTPELCLASTATEWGSSRWSEYRRCQKAHYLRYELGLERKPVDLDDDEDDRNTKIDYFAVGILVHACLQWTSDAAMRSEQNDWKQVIATAGSDCDERKAFDVGAIYEAERLVSEYFRIRGTENGGWPEGVKVLGTEVHLGAEPLERRADIVLELPSGEIVIGDTKTRAHGIPGCEYEKSQLRTGGSAARFIEDMQTNDQFLGLSYLAQKEYELEAPPAVWVNAIIKTKIPKFDRVLVPFTQEMVDRWYEEQRQWEDEYRRHADVAPLSNYSSCAPPIGSRCSFFYYCHSTDEKRDQLFQIRKAA